MILFPEFLARVYTFGNQLGTASRIKGEKAYWYRGARATHAESLALHENIIIDSLRRDVGDTAPDKP